MAKYKIIPSSRTIVQSPISIGHKAEKGVEAIEFDLAAWVETYGSGTLTVIMRRWGDAIPYPIALEIDENNKATWVLSDTDTAKAGMAYAQLNYIVGDEVVKKSDIYTFRVMDSLTGEGDPPEAYESWLEHLTHLAAEAMAEVLDIEGIVTDKTLTVDGGIADAKATGDALALKADKSTTYTKTEVDALIDEVEVETDTTLSVSGAPADAKKTGDELSALKADLGAQDEAISSAETRIADYDGVISTKWEIGGVSPNSDLTPPVTYVTIANAIRTPRGTTIHLKAGDIISLTDYSDCKVGIYGRKTADDSYTYKSNVVADTVIDFEGDYVIEIRLTDSTATADIEDLSSRVSITRANSAIKDIESLSTGTSILSREIIKTENRIEAYDGMATFDWEIGTLSQNTNLTPPCKYVPLTSGIRTPSGTTAHLYPGDIFELSSYTGLKISAFGRKTTDNTVAIKSNQTSAITIPDEGDYALSVQYDDTTIVANLETLRELVIVRRATSTVADIDDIKTKLKPYENIAVGNLMPNLDDWITGRVMSGEYDASVDTVKCTDFIPVVGGETYYIYGGFISSNYFGVYDEDKRVLSGWSFTSLTSHANQSKAVITLDQSACYIRINLMVNAISNFPDDAYIGLYPTCLPKTLDFSDYVPRIKGNGTLSDKKILIVGDSISTDVYGRYKKWVTFLCESGFFTSDLVNNNSFHTTGYVATYRENGEIKKGTFLTRVSEISDLNQYDLIITFGGINDWTQGVPFSDFANAVNAYYAYLINNAPQARIAVITPLRTSRYGENNTEGKTQKEYSDYIKSVAADYSFPVLDLTNEGGFCPEKSTSFKNMWTLLPDGMTSNDGVHPNVVWEKKHLAPQIAWFLAGLIG